MREVNENMENMEETLANQINDMDAANTQQENPDMTGGLAPRQVGQRLGHNVGAMAVDHTYTDEQKADDRKRGVTNVGGNIYESASIRDGWDVLDRALLGERNMFYPEGWEFRVRPATVEAIRNWAVIDDENPNVIDDVFTEILRTCLQIMTPNGPIPSTNINSWDRFFFILIIREYTFQKGEKEIRFSEDCPECNNAVDFKLTSDALMYDMPDPDVMQYYNPENQTWVVDSEEFDVDAGIITLYLPTIDKEANIKAWMIDMIQNKKKVDQVFIKFLTWMAPKISKDLTIAKKQIREYQYKFNMFDTDTFSLMNDIITNITVMPSQKLITKCPTCGEEVTADIRFQNGISSLFDMASGHKKFGKK